VTASFLPLWPLDPPPLLWFALTLVAAAVVGEFVFHRLRLPRISGYVLAGLVAGSLGGGEIVRSTLLQGSGWASIVVELALGVLLFELGNRVNLKWLRANPWLLATSLAEALATFGLVYFVLSAAGVPFDEALLVAAISMATAPAIVMRVVAETRAQGQVSDRLLMLAALNSIYTVLAVQLLLGWLHQHYRGDPVSAVLHPLYLTAGAVIAGAAIAWLMRALRSRLMLDDEHAGAVLIGLVLAAVLLLKLLKLPVLLTLLLAGLLVRHISGRPYVWPKGLSAVTGLLVLMLFVLTGVSVDISHLMAGGLTALLLIGTRLLAKTAAVTLLARPSGLSLRQGLALGVALTPMSGVAFVLTYDLLVVFPELAPRLAATVLAMIAMMELFGPIVVRWLLDWSDETPEHLRSNAPAAAPPTVRAPATVSAAEPVPPTREPIQ
jgi:Kef-type K+ transport system membrane component KefB